MPIQPGTFMRLPSKEVLEERVQEEIRHNADLTSYLWYILPVAQEFGDMVYEVAARSLCEESGIQLIGQELRRLAQELQTNEGKERYAKERYLHVFRHVTG